MLKVMEEAIRLYAKEKKEEFPTIRDCEWQVILRSDEIPKKIRDITSSMVAKLVVISGIIISTTKPYIKASKLKVQCRNCLATKVIEVAPGQNPYVPSYCTEGQVTTGQRCPNDPFIALPDSEVIDTQSMKIQ